MFKIIQIVFEFAFCFFGRARIHVELRPAREARADDVARVVKRNFGSERFHNVDLFGAWSHKTHITIQEVEKLREFIETCFAQEESNGRDPIIVFGCPRICRCSRLHRAIFDNGECVAVCCRSRLFEKDGAAIKEFHEDGDCGKCETEHKSDADAKQEIDPSLHDRIHTGVGSMGFFDKPPFGQVGSVNSAKHFLVQIIESNNGNAGRVHE